MPAYVITEIVVTDASAYERYKTLAEASIRAHGGRYLVRGGAVDSIEGAPVPGRVVVLEFPNLEVARAWYASDDYREALPVRLATASSRMFFVEGYSPA